jgi:hypothetical protein
MAGFRALSPNISVNTQSGQLRTELQNTFARLDGELQLAPYRIDQQTGPVGNTGAAETTLATKTIDVGTLAKQGSSILILAAGKTAANGNSKTIKLKFGSTTIFTITSAMNNVDWTLEAEVVRTGATAQITYAQFVASSLSTSQVGTAAIDLAAATTVSVTGTGVASSDVSFYYWKLILLT